MSDKQKTFGYEKIEGLIHFFDKEDGTHYFVHEDANPDDIYGYAREPFRAYLAAQGTRPKVVLPFVEE